MKILMTGTGSILTDRLSASVLIDDLIQIDVPNGYCKQMRKHGVDIKGIDVVLITHFHGDHYFDMPFLLLEMGLRQKRGRPLLIFGPRGLERQARTLHGCAFDNWSRLVANTKVEFIEISTEWVAVETRNGSYGVLGKQVKHGGIEAYGFIIRKDKNTIGYTGDTSFCRSVEEIVALSNIVVLDASFPQDKPSHMGLHTVFDLAGRPENTGKTFIATHMSDAARQAVTNSNIIIPDDGFVFKYDENI